MKTLYFRCRAWLGFVVVFGAVNYGEPVRKILNETKHLGIPNEPEWAIFAGKKPGGTNLVSDFQLPEPISSGEQTLLIRQDDVKQEWTVTLNGQKLGLLFLMEAPLVHTLAVPSGILRTTNRLEISAKARGDDIVLHEISLVPRPKAEVFTNVVTVKVHELGPGKAFPCRITITDEQGRLAAFHDFAATNLATRPGVIYSSDGQARIGLLPGKYTVFAGHGPEYSVDSEKIEVPGDADVDLAPEREVDTEGWISTDTHIHTFSLSKHGDATVRERAITLAAEGIEMPIITEHNQHTNYGAVPEQFGLSRNYTLVNGNEVTTTKGHFNIFPVSLEAPAPDYKLEKWPELFANIRKTPGLEIVILNHPTDTHSAFTPFAPTNLNLVTGRALREGFDFSFDAMEVINSGAMRSDWMEPFRAWFALLNRGRRITAVAASDSHDVSRFIVGQGRTYIHGDDSDPAHIDVAAACEELKRGRAVVSLGLFVDLAIRAPGQNEAYAAGPGELCVVEGTQLEFMARVACPGWVVPQKAVIYANGHRFAENRLNVANTGRHKNIEFSFKVPKPKHDTWFAMIAQGPGVTNQFWAVARPYQPTSKEWTPLVLGATNPVWVDADGDGHFTFAREYAEKIAELPKEKQIAELNQYDWAVAAQTAEILRDKGVDLESAEFQSSLSAVTREGVNDYLKTVTK